VLHHIFFYYNSPNTFKFEPFLEVLPMTMWYCYYHLILLNLCSCSILYQLKVVWAHYSTPLGWDLLLINDKGLKVQFCTGLLLLMSVTGLTSKQLVFDFINGVSHLFNFTIFSFSGPGDL